MTTDTPDGSAAAPRPAITLDALAQARLRELDPDGRNRVVARVMSAFETALVRMLGQLAVQRGRPDAAVLATIAHTLKPSSASIGALALAQACADVERRVRSGTPGDLDAELERLLAEGQAALEAVRAMLQP